MTFNVIDHILQDQSSHSPSQAGALIPHQMIPVTDTLRARLKMAMQEKGMTAAELSRKAGMNARAVKDIEEGRAIAPKISTVFALAQALNVPPSYLLGLADVPSDLEKQFLDLLRQYDPDGQERLLKALQALVGIQT